MKKGFTIFLTFITFLSIVFISIFISDKELVNKLTIFLTAFLSLLISFLIGLWKRKNGLINGLVIGISIAIISLIVHYIFAKEFFSLLYLRSITVILSGASGGIMGVNKTLT